MGDCMEFPKTIDEFIDDFKFKDDKQVYTNGSELIQVFRVKQALEHYAAQPKWISVVERLPEPEKDVLVMYCGKYVRMGWYSEEGNDWKVDDGFTDEVTHWMPLPGKPEVKT